MKPINSRIILYAFSTVAAVSVIVACGQNGFQRIPDADELGQNKLLERAAMPSAMTGIQPQLSENQLTDYVPSSYATGNTLGTDPSFSQQLDVPRAPANVEPDLNAEPFRTGLVAAGGVPYYCNPANYPPNITASARGCEDFQGIGPIGYPSRIRSDLIGYRVKPFVGSIGTRLEKFHGGYHRGGDDDDDGGGYRGRGFSGKKWSNNGGRKWNGNGNGSRGRRHRNELENPIVDLGPSHPSDVAKEPLNELGPGNPPNVMGPSHPSDVAKGSNNGIKFDDD